MLVTEPGASSAVISGVKQAAADAGATVTGEVAIQPKFNDLSGTTQSSLSQINSDLSSTDGTPLATPSNDQTLDQQQAAQLIGTAILATTHGGRDHRHLHRRRDDPARGVRAGRLHHDHPRRHRPGHAGGDRHPGHRALRRPERPGYPGAAGDRPGVRRRERGDGRGRLDGRLVPAGSPIAALRASSVASLVSTVDNADSIIGQVSTIWALAEQLRGEKPNSYGISGASAVSPVPLPVPSATPTVAPTPHPPKTGKGDKSVKKK